jgi:2'-5' RNA ligase
MRLFVAVDLDDNVRSTARETMETLRREPAIRRLDPRWVPAENLHITVRFIGHVPDDKAQSVIDVLKADVPVATFEATAQGCGAFPPSGAVRVIWIGLPGGCEGLAEIYGEMNRRLLPFGMPPENRPFSAHLTLARVKDAPRGVSQDARKALERCRVPPVAWTVREATVFQSHLSPHGPRYEALARATLKG